MGLSDNYSSEKIDNKSFYADGLDGPIFENQMIEFGGAGEFPAGTILKRAAGDTEWSLAAAADIVPVTPNYFSILGYKTVTSAALTKCPVDVLNWGVVFYPLISFNNGDVLTGDMGLELRKAGIFVRQLSRNSK